MDANQTESVTPSLDVQSPERFGELIRLVSSMEKDFSKFYTQGNKAAGTRIRQSMQELKAFAQKVRTEVLSMRTEGGKEPSEQA